MTLTDARPGRGRSSERSDAGPSDPAGPWGRAPRFWSGGSGPGGVALSLALLPVGAIAARATTRRARRPGEAVDVPVLCCGNATVGGAGKTTLALELVRRLKARTGAPHVLTRGWGGRIGRAVHRVDPARDPSALVGDEPLLLAATAPTWVSTDRVAAARAAIAAGADTLVLDDGLQNPGLCKTASFLVIDGATGFGNGLPLPAGPLREAPRDAAARCRAVVLIGADRVGATARLRGHLPVLAATLEPDPDAIRALDGRPVLAFAGLARPTKFFEGLAAAGVVLAATRSFPDHHPYPPSTIDHLLAEAAARGAVPVTTPKDAVRLSPAMRARVHVVGVSLRWHDHRIDAILDAVLGRSPADPAFGA